MPRIPFQLRLALAFGALIALYALIGAMLLWHLAQIDADAQAINRNLARSQQVQQWVGLSELNLERTLNLAHAGGSSQLAAYLQPRMQDSSQRITALQQSIDEGAPEPVSAMLREVRSRRQTYVSLRKRLLDPQSVAGLDPQRIERELVPAAAEYMQAIHAVQTWQQGDDAAHMAGLQAHMQRSSAMVLLSMGLGLLCGLALAWASARHVMRCLGADPQEVKRIADLVAKGHLHIAPLPQLRAHAQSSVMAAMLRMRAALAEVVCEVRDSAHAVEAACAQISAGNQDLASRTAEQASAIEVSNTLMHKLREQLGGTLDRASEADTSASRASQSAAQGGSVVAEVVASMDQIHGRSQRIAEITAVIDGLAFQTNILALNAAIEAARAGEHGCGFAVVAGEVRGLAQRCTHAAKEIKDLIDASVRCIEDGNVAAQGAGHTMRQVVSGIAQVSQVVSDMRQSGHHHLGATEDVRQTMVKLQDFAHQNSALVEESAAAASHLLAQASKLVRSVGAFSLA